MGTGAESSPEPMPLLAVDSLAVHFTGRRGQKPVRAVDGVSVSVNAGETLGVIGESGSGKSTLARAVLGLVSPTAGSVRIDGVEAWTLPKQQQRALRRRIQVVFQDAHEALDPRMSISASVEEPLRARRDLDPAARRRTAVELLDRVGLDAAYAARRPHELSGGQKQRVTIARALALDPEVVVCDEVVSALDVSVQAEILNLFVDLQAERGLSYLFISHDLTVVAHIADRIAVMYLGIVVESGPVDQLLDAPSHPYTKGLLRAQPKALPARMRGSVPPLIHGDIPSPADPPSGCRFRTRCPYRQQRCVDEVPALRPFGHQRLVACHFAEQVMEEDATTELVINDPTY